MKPWQHRSFEEATLLNPAFCSSLIIASTVGWQSEKSAGFPFVYSFLVPPIVLHNRTRALIPRTTKTMFANWIQDHQELKIGFFERASSLKPFVKEAILFGVSHGSLTIARNGDIMTVQTNKEIVKAKNVLGGETSVCIEKSMFLGKWLALSATIETTLALWGVSI